MRRVAQLAAAFVHAACGFLTHDGRVVEDAIRSQLIRMPRVQRP